MKLRLALLAALLPTAALAQTWSVEQLKARRGGFLEDNLKPSAEVVAIRGGEIGLLPGERLGPGEALRTEAGTVLLQDAEGRRLGLAERSQLRFDPDGPRLRIGELWVAAPDALVVLAGDHRLTVSGVATLRLSSTGGRISVVEGTVEGAPGGPVTAGISRAWTSDEVGADEPMTPDATAGLEAWRAERFEPSSRAGLARDRLHLRVAGGILYSGGTEWGLGGIEGRIRIAGPVWLALGGAFAGRSPFDGEPGPVRWTAPISVGPRFDFDLPRGFFLGGGIDGQVLVGAECATAEVCVLQTRVEPGVRAVLHGGVLLARRFGMDLQLAGGVARRRVPSLVAGEADTVVPDPQIDGTFGVFVRF